MRAWWDSLKLAVRSCAFCFAVFWAYSLVERRNRHGYNYFRRVLCDAACHQYYIFWKLVQFQIHFRYFPPPVKVHDLRYLLEVIRSWKNSIINMRTFKTCERRRKEQRLWKHNDRWPSATVLIDGWLLVATEDHIYQALAVLTQGINAGLCGMRTADSVDIGSTVYLYKQ